MYDEDLESETVACPACGEQVYEDADRCPYCGDWIVTTMSRGVPRWVRWVGLLLVCAMLLAVVGRMISFW